MNMQCTSVFKFANFYTEIKQSFKFHVLKFPEHNLNSLKYKEYSRCLYGSTYISVNMICHNEKNSTKIITFFLNSFHIYSWPHIKTLKFQMDSLTVLFPTENLYTFLFNPRGPHDSTV